MPQFPRERGRSVPIRLGLDQKSLTPAFLFLVGGTYQLEGPNATCYHQRGFWAHLRI